MRDGREEEEEKREIKLELKKRFFKPHCVGSNEVKWMGFVRVIRHTCLVLIYQISHFIQHSNKCHVNVTIPVNIYE
jgi:hypothetical protein